MFWRGNEYVSFAQAEGNKAAHLIINQRGQRKVIKQICKELPNVRIPIFPQTLVIKPINLSNLSRLVIPSQDRHSISVSQLECNEQSDSFNRVVSTINIVTHEEVVGVGGVTTDSEELGEIVELSVNITTDGDGASNRLDVGFFHEDFSGLSRGGGRGSEIARRRILMV